MKHMNEPHRSHNARVIFCRALTRSRDAFKVRKGTRDELRRDLAS